MVDWTLSSKVEHAVAKIITQQEQNGVLFDLDLALKIISDIGIECEAIYNALRPSLSYEVVQPYKNALNKPFIKAGGFSSNVEKWYSEKGYEIPDIGGPFSRLEFTEPDMGSREKFKKQLLRLGWKPRYFTEKGSPKITIKNEFDETVACPSLEETLGDLGSRVARYYIIKHRQSQTRGWVYGNKNNCFVTRIREDGRVPAGAIPDGTNTHRMTHKVVVNVPRASSVYGKDMRSLFMVPSGYKMVGVDAAQLELRCLAHRMGDENYIHQVTSGDVHWYTAQMMELIGSDIIRDEEDSYHTQIRDQEKRGVYSLIYGAGDAKFGGSLGTDAKGGKKIKGKLFKNLPALGGLIERVKRASRRGYLIGLDGRKIWMRKSKGKVMEHKALNTLLQCDGSLIVKIALIFVDKYILTNSKYDAMLLITMHDEVQLQVIEHQAEEVGKIVVDCFRKAGRFLKTTCPIDGDYKVGDNWSQTH